MAKRKGPCRKWSRTSRGKRRCLKRGGAKRRGYRRGRRMAAKRRGYRKPRGMARRGSRCTRKKMVYSRVLHRRVKRCAHYR